MDQPPKRSLVLLTGSQSGRRSRVASGNWRWHTSRWCSRELYFETSWWGPRLADWKYPGVYVSKLMRTRSSSVGSRQWCRKQGKGKGDCRRRHTPLGAILPHPSNRFRIVTPSIQVAICNGRVAGAVRSVALIHYFNKPGVRSPAIDNKLGAFLRYPTLRRRSLVGRWIEGQVVAEGA